MPGWRNGRRAKNRHDNSCWSYGRVPQMLEGLSNKEVAGSSPAPPTTGCKSFVLASTARGVCSLPESKWSDAHKQKHVVVTR